MKISIHNFFIRVCKFIKSLFVNGLITVLPLLLTIAILNMLFKFIKSLLEPVKNLIMSSAQFIPNWLQWIPHIEIVISILLILILGTFLNIFVFRSIFSYVEQWFSKIPFVSPIYSGMKQLVKSFGKKDQTSFQQVVLVKFPHEHMHTVGFITSQVPPHLAPRIDKTYVSVYVPTTPNPTGGFYLIVDAEELIPLDINRQEAMTLIMSVGMIKPIKTTEKEKN